MRITHELLVEKRACSTHRQLFRQLFPDGAELTMENLVKAQTAGLQVWWLERLMIPSDLCTYTQENNKLDEQLRLQTTPLWRVFYKTCTDACMAQLDGPAYHQLVISEERKRNDALRPYEQARDTAWRCNLLARLQHSLEHSLEP